MSDPIPPTADDKLVKPDSLGAKALAIVGGLVGVVFGKYCGVTLFVPGVVGGLSAWGLSKTLPADRKPVVAAAAVQIGHIAWMVVGLLLAGQLGPDIDSNLKLFVAVEVAVFSLLVAWFVAMPSWPSAGVLIVYQLIALGSNIVTIQELVPNTIEHKGIVTSIGLRVFAIICLITGTRTITKARQAELDSHFASTPRL